MANFLSNIIGGATDSIYGEGFKPQMADYNDPYAEQNRASLLKGLQAQEGRMAAIGSEDPWRTGQQELVGQLQSQAAGEGPSLAQGLLQQASDQNIKQQAGAMASNRGVGAGLAARMIGQQGAEAGQQLAGQAANLRAQEQMSAREQLAGALGQARAGDMQLGNMNDQMAQFYNQALMNQSQNQVANKMNAQQNFAQQGQLAAGQEAKNRGQFLEALGGAATYGMM